jgi:hypothetical protein
MRRGPTILIGLRERPRCLAVGPLRNVVRVAYGPQRREFPPVAARPTSRGKPSTPARRWATGRDGAATGSRVDRQAVGQLRRGEGER